MSHGALDAVVTSGDEGHGLPMAVRNFRHQPAVALPFGRPAASGSMLVFFLVQVSLMNT